MLEEPTVLILGAGASADYGFPLWQILKTRMLELCEDEAFIRKQDQQAVTYWQNKLSANNDQSVDGIAAEADDEANLLFRWMVGEILIRCEDQHLASGKMGWVEVFCKKLLSLPWKERAPELIENLGVVNLNYDRSFTYLYQTHFIDPFLQSFTRQREAKQFWSQSAQEYRRILHPHSALGLLPGYPSDHKVTIGAQTVHNPSEHMSVPYGDITDFRDRFFNLSMIIQN